MKTKSESGLSLIEVFIAIPFLVMVIGAVAAIAVSGWNLFETVTVKADTEQRAIRVLDRIAMELKMAARTAWAQCRTLRTGKSLSPWTA